MVTPGGVITTILTGVGPGLALDGAGNIYIADEYANLVRKVDVADAPSLTFAGTNVGSASLAQNVAIENLGNAQLNISRISVPSGFTLQGPETSCALSGQSLSAAASCILGIEFAPQTEGLISGSITLTDNALNVSNAQQQIGLSGGQALSITTNTALIWPGSAYCGPISCYPVYGQYVPLTATITWPPSDGPAPTGTVTFYDGTTKLGTAKLTITSGSAQANLTLQPNQLSLGSNSLQATYSGDSNYLGSSGTLSLTETIYSNAVNVLTTNYGSAIGGAAATLVGTPFVGSPGSLVAQVVDAYGNPLQGYTVTFMAPTGGPSATLSSSTAISDSNGLAYVNAPLTPLRASIKLPPASAAARRSSRWQI
jgi:archaellum component FlaF (FlaF/FlaG flagellin family)